MPLFPECRSLQRELRVAARVYLVPAQGRFLTFRGLLSCFLTLLLEVEKMSDILVLVFYMLLQRRGCFKGQKTGVGMKKPPVSLLAALSVWAMTCCQAAVALHSIRNTFTHLLCSPHFLWSKPNPLFEAKP